MFSFFAHPVYFYGLIAVLLAVSLVAVFSIGQEDKKARIIHENRLLESGLKVEELEKQLEDKDLAHKDAETRLNARIAEFAGAPLTNRSACAKILQRLLHRDIRIDRDEYIEWPICRSRNHCRG